MDLEVLVLCIEEVYRITGGSARHNNPAEPERSQVIGEMQRLSASG
jgi:hypothetical protein